MYCDEGPAASRSCLTADTSLSGLVFSSFVSLPLPLSSHLLACSLYPYLPLSLLQLRLYLSGAIPGGIVGRVSGGPLLFLFFHAHSCLGETLSFAPSPLELGRIVLKHTLDVTVEVIGWSAIIV